MGKTTISAEKRALAIFLRRKGNSTIQHVRSLPPFECARVLLYKGTLPERKEESWRETLEDPGKSMKGADVFWFEIWKTPGKSTPTLLLILLLETADWASLPAGERFHGFSTRKATNFASTEERIGHGKGQETADEIRVKYEAPWSFFLDWGLRRSPLYTSTIPWRLLVRPNQEFGERRARD